MGKCKIVAEIGQNHMGRMMLACQMIEEAKENGADMVKFQLYDHAKLYSKHPEIPDASLTFTQAKGLFDYGKGIGIEVFFSVFDAEKVKWCEEIGVKVYKIACNMRDKDTVRAIRNTGKPVIISGKQLEVTPFDVDAFLYCVPEYPAKDVILPSFAIFDGFSDHAIGLDTAKQAMDKGARMIEKHFSLSHDMGVDAQWSMTPEELKELAHYATRKETVYA